MGKKINTNEKAAAARSKKEEVKASQSATKSKAEEDEYWAAHANPKGKKDAKRDDEERRKTEAAKKKAELKLLNAQEELDLANLAKKKTPPVKKVTQHHLQLMSEAERREQAQLAEQRNSELRRDVSEQAYAQQIEVENTNKEDVAVEARSLDSALKQMAISSGEKAEDKHPEKRRKAGWEEFYARELPLLKEEKPGLKMMQYKNRIFEMWQRQQAKEKREADAAAMAAAT